MAKKRAASPSIGLILTLIFFILATFITGTVAYFGYADQEQFKKDIETAKTEKDKSLKAMRAERARKAVLRIAMGVDDTQAGESDKDNLGAQINDNRAEIMDEYERILRGLGGPLDNAFKWRLLKEGAADPDVAPLKTIPQIVQAYKEEAKKAKDAEDQAKRNEQDAIAKRDAAEKAAASAKDTYVKALADLAATVNAFQTKQVGEFKALADKHKADAANTIADMKKIDDKLKEKTAEADKVGDLNKEIRKRLKVAEDQANLRVAGFDAINLEERKGEIVRREENGFVTVNIGSSKKLKPQVTFLVVQSNISWLAMLEKEKSLDKSSTRVDRQAFEDNPYVKAGIEIVEITGPETSRAKVIFENEPIRNPIQPKDQIFNLAWEPNEEMRIAFAGIIDLDGDGLDNNEDFLRLLERQGVIVDEYLKLKPLEFVKRDNRGLTLRTKYLVIAPDPRIDSLPVGSENAQSKQVRAVVDKMSDIKGRARELGIQMIEAHKFLSMIGYKLPRNPLPPAYGAGVYVDPNAPAPMAEPKEAKDKKDEKEKN